MMKRSPLHRTAFKVRPRTKLKAGRKTKDWIAVRRELSAEFAEKGIQSCEVRISEHCAGDNWLSFAHSRKRRFIKTVEELRECCLSCVPCHQILDERLSHEEMLTTIQKVIAERNYGRTQS